MAFLKQKTALPPITDQEADQKIAQIKIIYTEFEEQIQDLKKQRQEIINTILTRVDQQAAEQIKQQIEQ